MYEIVAYTFFDVCEKITSFRQVLIRCAQKKIGSFFLPHSVECAPFSALTLLIGRQEGHPACKN